MLRRNKSVEEWVERMTKLIVSPGTFESKRQFIKQNCPRGMTHFCDGRLNPGYAKADMKRKPPCGYFKNGRCTFEKMLDKKEKS